MAVSVSSMSDEPHSSYSSPLSRVVGNDHRGNQQKKHAVNTRRGEPPSPPQHKTRGWARFKSRFLGGGRKKNRRGDTDRAAEPQSAFTQGTDPRQHQIMMLSVDERQSSVSALTQGSLPLYSQPPPAAAASRRNVGFARDSKPQSYAGHSSSSASINRFKKPPPSSKPRAYRGSYYNGQPTTAASTRSHSMSARDFRGKSLNAFAYSREDESYANIANRDIDEDLEVSYFNP